MKNKTKRNLAIGTGVVLIANAVLVLIGCPEPEIKYIEVEVPDPTLIYRETEINITYGNKGKVRVEGTLTESEWNGVPAKVKAALDLAYAKTDIVGKGRFDNVFSRTGVTIIVTKGLSATNTYKANNGNTFYLNLDKLDSEDFPDKIITLIEAMDSYSLPAVGQIKKQSRVRFGGDMSPFELV